MNVRSGAGAIEFSIERESDITLAAMSVASQRTYLPATPSDERGILGTIVSELATNIIKYAGRGRIRVTPVNDGARAGVRIEAWDQGPGIADIEAALREGFSTGGTLGLGLPAVRRLTDQLTIDCPQTGGTRVDAIRWTRRPFDAATVRRLGGGLSPGAVAREPLRLTVQTRHRPYRGLSACGDRAWWRDLGLCAVLAQLDGTGHGTEAERAAARLVACMESETAVWPPQPKPDQLTALMDACHQAAVGTVGAAATLVLIDRQGGLVHHVSVGNTCIMQFSPSGWEGIARPGILGQRYSRPLLGTEALRAGESLVLFSDGLSSSAVRQLRRRLDRPTDPSAIADWLMTFAKPTDDASCLVLDVA